MICWSHFEALALPGLPLTPPGRPGRPRTHLETIGRSIRTPKVTILDPRGDPKITLFPFCLKRRCVFGGSFTVVCFYRFSIVFRYPRTPITTPTAAEGYQNSRFIHDQKSYLRVPISVDFRAMLGDLGHHFLDFLCF
jgi:hypothetical protein